MLIISEVVENIFMANSNSLFRITANLKISSNISHELVTDVLSSLLRLDMSTKLIFGVQPSVGTIQLLPVMFILTALKFFIY